MEELRSLLGGTADHSVVCIEGPAGIGKTRLLDEALARTSVGAVLRVRCREDRALAPLSVIAELVGEPHEPDVAADERLLDRIETLAVGGERVVVVVDDLQWCDERSASVLRVLVPRASEIPVGLVVATRREPRTKAVAKILNDVERAGRKLVLHPLDRASVAVLAAARPELSEREVAAAGGHPFLLTCLLHDEPDGAGAHDLTRALPLASEARRLLALAAAFGGSFTATELARLAHQPVASIMPHLEEAIALGVVQGAGGALAFSHDLWREAFSSAIEPSVRAALHREIAAARLQDGHSAVSVSWHLREAVSGTDDELARWLADAARHAARGDLRAGVTLCEHALAVAGTATRLSIETDLISYLAWDGEADRAIARARALLLYEGDSDTRYRIHTRLALALSTAGRSHDAATEARAALRTGRCTPAQEANLRVIEALEHWIEDPWWTLEATRAAEARARDMDVPTAVVSALVGQLRALDSLGDFDAMAPIGREVRAMVEDLWSAGSAPPGWRAWALIAAAEALLRGDFDDEALELASALVHAVARLDATPAGDVVNVVLTLHLRAGRWDDALAQIEAWGLLELEHPEAAAGNRSAPRPQVAHDGDLPPVIRTRRRRRGGTAVVGGMHDRARARVSRVRARTGRVSAGRVRSGGRSVREGDRDRERGRSARGRGGPSVPRRCRRDRRGIRRGDGGQPGGAARGH